MSLPTSIADDHAAVEVAHHVDRQVVHRAAVDVHVAAVEHRRQHARDRDRGAQPAPQRAAAVHRAAAGRQVGGDRVERQRQVLDRDVAELLPQQPADLATGHQRDDRQRVVVERVGGDEGAAEALDHLRVGPAGGDAGADDRADAGAADEVDRHAGLAQRAHHADVREAARAAAGEHEADGLAGQ